MRKRYTILYSLADLNLFVCEHIDDNCIVTPQRGVNGALEFHVLYDFKEE